MDEMIAAAAASAKAAIVAGHQPADAFKLAGALFALVAPTPIQPAPVALPPGVPSSLVSRLQQAAAPAPVAAPGAVFAHIPSNGG